MTERRRAVLVAKTVDGALITGESGAVDVLLDAFNVKLKVWYNCIQTTPAALLWTQHCAA